MKSLKHLHDNGIIHKDVKLENLVFLEKGKGVGPTGKAKAQDDNPKSPKMLKLIDFDFTEEWEPGSPRSKAVVGTDGYIAPECYHGDTNPKGENYVGNAKMKEIYNKMERYWDHNGNPAKSKDPKMFASRAWTKLREAREFVMKCMEFDFQKRYDAEQALNDPWIKDLVTPSMAAGK